MEVPDETIALERLLGNGDSKAAVLEQFLRTVVVVPIVGSSDNGVSPLLSATELGTLALAFTTGDQALQVADKTSIMSTMTGVALVATLPAGIGIALMGSEGNAAFDERLLLQVREDLLARAQTDNKGDNGHSTLQ